MLVLNIPKILIGINMTTFNEKILIVEDEDINIKILKKGLGKFFNLTIVNNGQDAIEIIPSLKPAIILLDVMLPVMNGLDVAKHIRSNPSFRDIKIIMISVKNNLNDVLKGYDAGANDYITKPFHIEELIAKIRSFLKIYHGEFKLKNNLISQEQLASLGMLSAGIAHEIKNPLNFIINYSQMIDEVVLDCDEFMKNIKLENEHLEAWQDIHKNFKEASTLIVKHSFRIDDIVQSMLTKASTSKDRYVPIDIKKIVESSVNMAYHTMRCKYPFSISPTVEIQDELIINAYPSDLSRAFINLFENSFYALNEKHKQEESDFIPSLSIICIEKEKNIEISIKDNGPGINAEIMKNIFDPFVTTKPSGSGTGLGLYISHDIIAKHRGEMHVKSKEGQYTEFLIILPLDDYEDFDEEDSP